MCNDSLARVRKLSQDARRRVESFLDEARYYGWKLKSVDAKTIGDHVLCTLDFDAARIMFFARTDEAGVPAQVPSPRPLTWSPERSRSHPDGARRRTTHAHHVRQPARPSFNGFHPIGA